MTTLPKRKPARRPAMAEPEPRPVLSWEELTAPLEHYRVPVILTDAERAGDDAWRDANRAAGAGDRDDVTQWHAQACMAVFGPLEAARG